MAKLLINDGTENESMYYPTHIVSKDKKPLPVFIGASQTMIRGLVGIYVSDKDYELIRHDKAYIFIHDPDVWEGDIQHVNWDDIVSCINGKTVNRECMHIWK